MFIDLDGFKAVNDRLGHEIGDARLKTVVRKLRAIMRRTDMVARVGGDEFVALFLNIQSEEPVARIARSMIVSINEALRLVGKVAQVGVSIGVAMYPSSGGAAADLMRDADAAIYAAKTSGKNAYRFASSAAPTGVV
jgi:diguanylate cyclase (GGDEF)-like protein